MSTMRRLYLLFAFFPISVFAQDLEPVQWTAALEDTASMHSLILKGSIEPGWYVYSQFVSDEGPIPTEVVLDEGAELQIGQVHESGEKRYDGMDEMFGMEIVKYSGFIQLKQLLKASEGSEISGKVIYMSCNDAMCLPPEEFDFTLQLP